MANAKALKNKEPLRVSSRRFFALVSMLFSDTMKLSFLDKTHRKSSIINIVSSLLAFAGLTALAVGLYSVAVTLHVFSVLDYIPETVPSLIAAVLLILSFSNSLLGLIRTLYFSEDNRVIITYPCKGVTIFAARILVFFICEYLRSVLVFIPVLFGYMIVAHFSWVFYLWVFVALFFVVMAEVVVASLFSVPGYYFARFFKRNSLLESVGYFTLFALFVGVVAWLISLLPNKIDISSNWGPIFAQIKSMLAAYRDNLRPFYSLTLMEIGYTNGFSKSVFTLESGVTLLCLLGVISLGLVIVFFGVSHLYLQLASTSFEYSSDNLLRTKKSKTRPYWFSQMAKELILFFKTPETFMSLFSVYVFLPIFVAILNKVFGAMDTTIVGKMYVSVVNVLIILLVMLCSNGAISHIYSDEGKAFLLDRSYPRSSGFLLFSKLILPMAMGFVSILVTCLCYGLVSHDSLPPDGSPWINPEMLVGLTISLASFYFGHLLFSAGLDFCSLKNTFVAETLVSENEKRSVVSAFFIAFLMAVLFYFFLRENVETGYLKLMIFGLLYLLFNIILFIRKIRYLYREGA
jgi:ABC-2 type transport system permease protein